VHAKYANINAMDEVIPAFTVAQQSMTQLSGVATGEEKECCRHN
jgi:hypothetical protein